MGGGRGYNDHSSRTRDHASSVGVIDGGWVRLPFTWRLSSSSSFISSRYFSVVKFSFKSVFSI